MTRSAALIKLANEHSAIVLDVLVNWDMASLFVSALNSYINTAKLSWHDDMQEIHHTNEYDTGTCVAHEHMNTIMITTTTITVSAVSLCLKHGLV